MDAVGCLRIQCQTGRDATEIHLRCQFPDYTPHSARFAALAERYVKACAKSTPSLAARKVVEKCGF